MFTGIIAAVGEVREVRPIGTGAGDMRLVIGVPGAARGAAGPAPAVGGAWPAAVAAGGLLFLAAQGPRHEATGAVVGHDVAAQAEVCLNRLLAAMEAHGHAVGDAGGALVRLGVSLADPEDAVAVEEVLASSLPHPLPVCSMVAGAGFGDGELVRIEGVARHAGGEGGFLAGALTGASIACAGCCLTLVEQGPDWFAVEVSAETLSLTTLGGWRVGAPVNLERSLRLGDELGGHMVSGHVDGLGTLVSSVPENGSVRLSVRLPAPLAGRLVHKGSVAVNGVSLTVNAVQGDTFGVNIIPHTAAVTTLGALAPGEAVNIEVDRMARAAAADAAPGPGAPAWT